MNTGIKIDMHTPPTLPAQPSSLSQNHWHHPDSSLSDPHHPTRNYTQFTAPFNDLLINFPLSATPLSDLIQDPFSGLQPGLFTAATGLLSPTLPHPYHSPLSSQCDPPKTYSCHSCPSVTSTAPSCSRKGQILYSAYRAIHHPPLCLTVQVAFFPPLPLLPYLCSPPHSIHNAFPPQFFEGI